MKYNTELKKTDKYITIFYYILILILSFYSLNFLLQNNHINPNSIDFVSIQTTLDILTYITMFILLLGIYVAFISFINHTKVIYKIFPLIYTMYYLSFTDRGGIDLELIILMNKIYIVNIIICTCGIILSVTSLFYIFNEIKIINTKRIEKENPKRYIKLIKLKINKWMLEWKK